MPNRLEQFEREVILYEERPRAPVEVVEEGGSPWRAFRHDPKILRPDVADVIEHAFECGGFVAGGCGRWLRNAHPITATKRGAYVHEGGDIDLFFKDGSSWAQFLSKYSETTIPSQGNPAIAMSQGKLAANITFAIGKGLNHGYNASPTVQAIRCVTGTPEEVILSFDFVNSMVAFDRDRVWVADGWEACERSKTLGIAWWGSRSVAFRVRKYVQKYGYKSIKDLSQGQMLEQLIQVTNAMELKRQILSREAWFSIVRSIDLPHESKLSILASTFSGLESNEIFELMRDTSTFRNRVGGYQLVYDNLIFRHERSKKRAMEAALNPPPSEQTLNPFDLDAVYLRNPEPPSTFDSEEYCWAR